MDCDDLVWLRQETMMCWLNLPVLVATFYIVFCRLNTAGNRPEFSFEIFVSPLQMLKRSLELPVQRSDYEVERSVRLSISRKCTLFSSCIQIRCESCSSGLFSCTQTIRSMESKNKPVKDTVLQNKCACVSSFQVCVTCVCFFFFFILSR